MKDIRKILVKGLIPALNTATGLTSYTVVPKDAAYPYVYVSDIYQSEDGPKDKFHYEVELLVQVVYSNIESLEPLYDKMDAVLGMSLFSLDSPYAIQERRLISSNDTTIDSETGKLFIGLIRLNFFII